TSSIRTGRSRRSAGSATTRRATGSTSTCVSRLRLVTSRAGVGSDALLHPSRYPARVPRPLASGGVHAEAGPLAAPRAHPARRRRRDRAGRRGGRVGLSRARSGALAELAALELPEKRPLRQLADALTPRRRHRLPALAFGGRDAEEYLGAAPRRDGAARQASVLAAVRAPHAPALDDRLAPAACPITVVGALL